MSLPKLLIPVVLTVLIFPMVIQAQERLCDPAFEDCRTPLWNLIDAETVGIDRRGRLIVQRCGRAGGDGARRREDDGSARREIDARADVAAARG